ncbi:hypothetical protein J6590_095809 [Homalodisca vitripennis]|nr:hypothetical protein J6590_095809 [Homalodisca vitripennis]
MCFKERWRKKIREHRSSEGGNMLETVFNPGNEVQLKNNLLWRMAVGVGGVCSLTSEALVNLNKGVPPPAYFDWRGWFTAGLPSSGMTLRCSALILPHGSR